LQIATLHLFVEIVGQLKLVQVNAQVHQRVLGLLAGIELLQFHFFDQFQCRVEILSLRVSLEQDVVGYQVWSFCRVVLLLKLVEDL